jgi:hypothetical protein
MKARKIYESFLEKVPILGEYVAIMVCGARVRVFICRNAMFAYVLSMVLREAYASPCVTSNICK